jgi:hypothetical protein
VPVLRHRRPASAVPNPWSHPLPLFYYKDEEIRVKFLSDPALPKCTQNLYPDEAWKSGDFLLAAQQAKKAHMHPLADFSPWIPNTMSFLPRYDDRASFTKTQQVVVEAKLGNGVNRGHLWDIILV